MDTVLFAKLENETGWSRELLYQLIDNIKDYAILVTDRDGVIVSWNAGAEKIFGYTAREAIGQKAHITFTPEDQADKVPEKEMETAVREGRAEDERWHMRKDGSRFFASGLQTPLYDSQGRHTGYAKIARDLTERIVAQEELHKALESVDEKVGERTQNLNAKNRSLRLEIVERQEADRLRALFFNRIIKTQEDERKRIARDIHDNVGQQITALQLRLQLLVEKYEDDADMTAELAQIKSIANSIDSEVDFLAWELRPSVLDDFGLGAAAHKFTREWSEHYDVPAVFDTVGLDGRRLLPEIEINLYRIIQEALNNVAKHAQAKQTAVLIEHRDEQVSVIVEDDGVGFDTDEGTEIKPNDRGIGLLNMKERAELVGGTFVIESTPGSGTSLYVRVPAKFDSGKEPETSDNG